MSWRLKSCLSLIRRISYYINKKHHLTLFIKKKTLSSNDKAVDTFTLRNSFNADVKFRNNIYI